MKTADHTSNGIRVLLIEDNPKDSLAMQKLLSEVKTIKLKLENARGLPKGLEILARGGVDAVLLDNSLPGGTGLDNLVKVQSIANGVPVIVLSDKDDSASESEVISMGAQDFLLKKKVNARAMARILYYAIERQRIRTTLEKAVSELQELNQLKSDFISSVSHELHTPLTVIIVAVNNFLDGIFGDLSDIQRTWISRIKSNSERLTNLINDILDLAKLESGRLKLNWKKFDMVRLIQETLLDIEPMAQERKINITMNLPPAPVEVYAAEARIGQLLVNLLTNSIKYTNPGGQIWIKLGPENHSMNLEVADNGIGIDPTKLDVVFERFLQLGKDKTSTPGIGLGLAICKEIATLHQGRVWAESEGVGKGSRFIFTFPSDLQGKRMRKPAVLVVDNDPAVLDLFDSVLKGLGCEVILAKDGAEAIGHIVSSGKHSPFDLLIVDLVLPVRNGTEVLKEAKRINPKTAVIIITGHPNNKLMADAMEIASFTLIKKPFKMEEVTKTISSLILAPEAKE